MVKRCIEWRLRAVGNGIFLTNSLRVFEINSTAAKVFLLCDGKNDIDKIVAGIKASFFSECSDQEIREDTLETLKILKKIGAILEEV